jgi:hypothetical protein
MIHRSIKGKKLNTLKSMADKTMRNVLYKENKANLGRGY